MAEQKPAGVLEILDPSEQYEFDIPSKRINDGEDVTFWLQTYAYTDIMTFLLQLNAAMFPRKQRDSQRIQTWELDAENIQFSSTVLSLRSLLQKLEKVIDEAPPDPGPRRFGNMSFRKWYQIVEERIDQLLEEHVPRQVLEFGHWNKIAENLPPKSEIKKYLLGSFGSAQRLDYGTGHELSFLAFIGCLWKLNGFDSNSEPWGTEERGIVLGVIEPYLHLIRKLILTYTLEPAGSHGVWGLDDHSFLPYIFGSAQLGPAINSPADIPQEGSAPDAPKPGDIAKSMMVERERKKNMYFSAIGFIYDVKKGPFWEHSPILFDISGVTAGWAKINKGMIKMYNAEVLSKFPVVQHFPFGYLFLWTHNPNAPKPITITAHTSSQPQRSTPNPSSSVLGATTIRPAPGMDGGTKAPWMSAPIHRSNALPGPTVSWTGQSGAPGMPATKAPWAGAMPRAPPGATSRPTPAAGSSAGTAAPWARPVPAAQTTAPALRPKEISRKNALDEKDGKDQ